MSSSTQLLIANLKTALKCAISGTLELDSIIVAQIDSLCSI